jgi:hypothetical protein
MYLFDWLKFQIKRFQRNWGMDPMYMPSRKSFERAGNLKISNYFHYLVEINERWLLSLYFFFVLSMLFAY